MAAILTPNPDTHHQVLRFPDTYTQHRVFVGQLVISVGFPPTKYGSHPKLVFHNYPMFDRMIVGFTVTCAISAYHH